MASTPDYLAAVLDQLALVPGVTSKKMMGEYLLYAQGTLFGGIYDDRFLVKPTATARERFASEEVPYPGAKPMRLVDVEEPAALAPIIAAICAELKK